VSDATVIPAMIFVTRVNIMVPSVVLSSNYRSAVRSVPAYWPN